MSFTDEELNFLLDSVETHCRMLTSLEDAADGFRQFRTAHELAQLRRFGDIVHSKLSDFVKSSPVVVPIDRGNSRGAPVLRTSR